RSGFEHQYIEPACLQCNSDSCADRSATDNYDVVISCRPCNRVACTADVWHTFMRHVQWFIKDSICSIVFGADAEIISLPDAVTNASSSIRTPMFQNCSGTPSPGRT